MRKIYLLIFAAFSLTTALAQTTVSFTADKDNTIYSAFTNSSNGSGDFFFVGRQGPQHSSSLVRALLHFNVSSIPAGAVINSATLTLYPNKTGGASTGIALHKLSEDWGEGASNASGLEGQGAEAQAGDATWNANFYSTTSWSTPGGTFDANQTAVTSDVSPGTAVVISNAGLVADVQSWINNASTNFGWIIRASDETPTNSAKRFVSRNSGTIAQRPTLSITYTAGSVPVTLKSFAATLKNGSALLEWKTATEINNKLFDIEHSTNGTSFRTVGKVNGSGNSTKELSYSFTHSNIGSGKHYYRLAQYDFDGAVKYSQVVLVTFSKTGQLQVKPNPAASFINVTASSALNGTTYFITSSLGQVVKKGILSSQQIDVQQLPSGQYWLSVEAGKGDILRTGFMKK